MTMVDLKERVGLKNVVLHFRVPRNGVSRRMSRQGLSTRALDRMRTEENTRRFRWDLFEPSPTTSTTANVSKGVKRPWSDVVDEGGDGGSEGGGETKSIASTDNGAYPRKVVRRAKRGGRRSRRGGGGGGGMDETYQSLGEGRNFFVLAADGEEERFVYTIFPASGCVVATGLRSYPRFLPAACAEMLCPLPDALKTFCGLTGVRPENIWDVRVTNSTWSGSLRPRNSYKETLGSVMEMLSRYSSHCSRGRAEEEAISIDFRSQFFPGARLQHAHLAGVINLFNNGSFVIVGVRSEKEVDALLRWLAAIINEFWKKPPGEKSYAWTVGSFWKLCSAWEEMKL